MATSYLAQAAAGKLFGELKTRLAKEWGATFQSKETVDTDKSPVLQVWQGASATTPANGDKGFYVKVASVDAAGLLSGWQGNQDIVGVDRSYGHLRLQLVPANENTAPEKMIAAATCAATGSRVEMYADATNAPAGTDITGTPVFAWESLDYPLSGTT